MNVFSSVTSQLQAVQSKINFIQCKLSIVKAIFISIQEIEKINQSSISLVLETSKEISNLNAVNEFLALSKALLLQHQNEANTEQQDAEVLLTHVLAYLKKIESQLQNNLQTSDISNELESQLKIVIDKTKTAASSMWGHSTSLLNSLQAALSDLHKQRKYESAYLIRQLFIQLVLLNITSSPEEVQRAIELELEHLDSVFFFQNQPGSDQEKYNNHLGNCLFLLARKMGLIFQSSNLNEQLSEVLYCLGNCLPVLSAADAILIRRALVFFLTRPEWFFHQDFFQAKVYLEQAKQLEKDKALQNKIELQSIILEINQATSSKSECKKELNALLKRIIPLLKESSPSDAIIALSAGAKIYEALAGHADDQPIDVRNLSGTKSSLENLIDKLLKTLSDAIKKGEENDHLLDFNALQALANCRFLFGFYSSLCFQTKQEYENGRSALLKISQDFWADKQMRQAAESLNEYLSCVKELPNSIKIKKEKFKELFCFKLMMQNKINDLFSYDDFELNLNEFSKDRKLEKEPIWQESKKKFIISLFNNNIKEMQAIVNAYLSFHIGCANALIQPYYKEGPNYRFRMTLDGENIERSNNILLPDLQTTDEVVPIKNLKSNVNMNVMVNEENLKELLVKSKDNPLIGPWLAMCESQCLKNIFLEMAIYARMFIVGADYGKNQNSQIQATESKKVIPFSNLEWFEDIYAHIKILLERFQGDLNYKTVISSTMKMYLKVIAQSKLIEYILNFSFPSDPKEKKQILNLRHHLPTLIDSCKLVIEAYEGLDHCVNYPYHQDYDGFYIQALNGAMIGFYFANSREEKIVWILKKMKCINKRHLHITQRVPSDPIEMENIGVQSLASQLILSTLLPNNQGLIDLRNTILSNLGETIEAMRTALLPSKVNQVETSKNDLNEQYFNIIILSKLVYLFENQKVEAGTALYKAFTEAKKVKGGQNLNWWGFSINPKLFDVNKMRTGIYEGDNDFSSSSFSEYKALPKTTIKPKELSSEKQRILNEGEKILQSRLLKLEKKQAKVASESPTTTAAVSTARTSHATTSAQEERVVLAVSPQAIKKELNPTEMELFNHLLQENTPSKKPWMDRSFRNDIIMTRKEALILIRALGGSYFPKRGKGSHSLASLPKIEFNGEDMGGLVDWEKGKLSITLTKDKKLKFYQINQLRNMFLKKGFNPDTVKLKSA